MNVEISELLRSLFVYDRSDPTWTQVGFAEGLSDHELARRIGKVGPGPWVDEWAPVAEIDSYYTMLMLCIQEEWVQSAIALLQIGADPSLSIPKWAKERKPWEDSFRSQKEPCEVPLVRAASNSQTSVVRALLQAGADPNQVEEDRRLSALYTALGRRKDVETVRLLLEAGADPLAETEEGSTPLYSSQHHGTPEMHALILEAAKKAPRKHPVVQFLGKRHSKHIKPGATVFGKRRWNANLGWAMIFARGDFDSVLDASAEHLKGKRVVRNISDEPKLSSEGPVDFIYQPTGCEWVTFAYGPSLPRMSKVDPLPLTKKISQRAKECWVFQPVIVKRLVDGQEVKAIEWIDEHESVDWTACDTWFKGQGILLPNLQVAGDAPHPRIEFMGIRPDTIARVAALELPKQD